MRNIEKQIIKGFRVRIYPDKEQEKLLHYYCDISHKAWNELVAYFRGKMEEDKKFKVVVNSFGIKDFNERDLENLIFSKEFYNISVPGRIFKSILRNYSDAWYKHYKRINNSEEPVFHKCNINKKSFGVVSQTNEIRDIGIRLPIAHGMTKKILKKQFYINLISAYIPINQSFLEKFNITEVIEPRFTYQRGKWYLSGSYKVNIKQNKSEDYLGLDWGIKNFMTDNNGNVYNYPLSVVRQFYRIKSLRSKKDKKVKHSNNWKKASDKLDLAYERFANLKRDFIEQTTTELSNYNIAVEKLENAKTLKLNKNRRRLQQINPRYNFVRRLEQKCNQKGNDFIKVNPAYTSLTCSECGLVKDKKELPTSIRNFVCECGLHIDRDVNAAINIVARAYC